jgi:hypothetical protein
MMIASALLEKHVKVELILQDMKNHLILTASDEEDELLTCDSCWQASLEDGPLQRGPGRV